MSWTDRVVTVVVSALCALQDRDQSAEVRDEMCVKLDNVASYMDELEKYLMILWEQSCQAAQKLRGAGDATSLGRQLGALLDREDFAVDFYMFAVVGRLLSSSSPEVLEFGAFFDRRIARGQLELLSDDVKDRRKLRDDVGDKEKLEEKFSKFFQDLVSTWNPSFLNDGCSRFDWDAEEEAPDVEAPDVDYCAKEGDGLYRWSERVLLSKVLEETFKSNGDTSDGEQVGVRPLRRLVAALVQCSARHDLHGKDRLVIGVHVCVRGKPGCANCRFGCPIKVLRLRLGGCDCILVKEDREGWWRLRTPRNDELRCLYEGRVLLANFGNIDWRPCLNLWAVVQYISKYATKAPTGSCRMFFGNRAARRRKKAARRQHLRWLGYQTGFGSRLVSLSRKRR